MIGTCLEMADKDGAATIAFPTVGCGRLHYRSDDVVDCFIRATQRTRSNIKVCLSVSLCVGTHLVSTVHLVSTGDIYEHFHLQIDDIPIYRGSCWVSRVYYGIRWLYRVGFRLGLVLGCVSPAHIMCK